VAVKFYLFVCGQFVVAEQGHLRLGLLDRFQDGAGRNALVDVE
jgi:hypothetical protein